jgi:hypothetical protein
VIVIDGKIKDFISNNDVFSDHTTGELLDEGNGRTPYKFPQRAYWFIWYKRFDFELESFWKGAYAE